MYPPERRGRDALIEPAAGGRHVPLFPLLLSALLALAATATSAAAPERLLDTTTTWEGGALSYPEGEARVTAVMLRIDEGDEPPFHCHPVPTMGYVLRGEVEVETASGKTAVFREGDSVVEVMRTVHRGKALRGPVEIIVFYAGATGVPVSVLPADDPDGQYCSS
ncbi:MAG: cupin domain-containing protein [Halioglobus sp.]|nr:cupin domain-containing protein [Halioglobus sp.]